MGRSWADPDKGILYINSNEWHAFLRMKNTEDYGFEVSQGEQKNKNCSSCHKLNFMVKSQVDTLVLFHQARLPKTNSRNYCQGKGMPGFLNYQNIQLLLDYLSKNDNKSVSKSNQR